ncbi:hypothetical protein KSP39_PZI008728 [Platanthera zijinensis]|uniref:Uncharacterized protein n=1 Tax=Platanthera zijinensis TaxID=2320716 RepID=A0AAP0BKJ4_9ASPA
MAAAASRSWKLYHNHHFLPDSYNDSPHFLISYQSTSTPTHSDPISADMIATDHKNLALAVAEIGKLRDELELERRMRRSAESQAKSIARELAEERGARAESEAKAVQCLKAAGRGFREVDEERRMPKIAEALREERVQMRTIDAAIVLDERMQEVAESDMQKVRAVDCVVAVRNGRERRGRESENPHIMRGIKGFVEFSRAFRVRLPGSGREKERAGGDLECQRAQLKVLLKQRCTADFGMTAAAQNLV